MARREWHAQMRSTGRAERAWGGRMAPPATPPLAGDRFTRRSGPQSAYSAFRQ